MKLSQLKLLPAAAALAMMCAAGGAQAGAYGYSYDNIFGLTISNPTGVVTVASSTNISRSTSTLNGVSVINGGSGQLDSPQSAVGAVTKGQNDFTQQGPTGTYARGDAQIVSTQFPPFPAGATSTQAVNVAEAHLERPAPPTLRAATGRPPAFPSSSWSAHPRPHWPSTSWPIPSCKCS